MGILGVELSIVQQAIDKLVKCWLRAVIHFLKHHYIRICSNKKIMSALHAQTNLLMLRIARAERPKIATGLNLCVQGAPPAATLYYSAGSHSDLEKCSSERRG